jgi:hypothetical protein
MDAPEKKRLPPYGMTTPCSNCPFRKDITPFLRPERVREIERSLVRSEFPCHKTTKHDDDGEYVGHTDQEMHCAGALILKEKLGQSSQMMRIAERLGMYDHTKLDMNAPVFDSFDEMYEAMCREHRPRRRKKA